MSTTQISAQSTAYRPRILFLGENWYGSCARACCYALRRLGCDVLDIDVQTFVPQWRQRSNRGLVRVLRPRVIREYNEAVIHYAAHFRPDILLAFKGPFVEPGTLRRLRECGIAEYNYYPDRLILVRGTLLEESLPEYDCVFDTKRYWDGNTEDWLKLRRTIFLPHGYDSEVHRPYPISQDDVRRYGSDVTFVGNHSRRKQQILEAVVQFCPELNLRLWGDGWARAPRLRRFVQGWGPRGDEYARIVVCSRINLAIMGVNEIARDETTTRTFEIPACAGFMLHERTPELLELYEEGKEVACFGSVEELAEKIQHYLAHPQEREAIARAGHARCVPAYSYDNRVKEILSYNENSSTEKVDLWGFADAPF